MANSRLRSLSGLNSELQEQKESRFSQLNKETANKNDDFVQTNTHQENDIIPIEERKNILFEAQKCKSMQPEKKSQIEAIEAKLQDIKCRIETIKSYISMAEDLARKVSQIRTAYENAYKAAVQKSGLTKRSLLGGYINRKVLEGMGMANAADTIIELQNQIYDMFYRMDESNPLKKIEKTDEYNVIKKLDKDASYVPWKESVIFFDALKQSKAVVENTNNLNVVLSKSDDIKFQCYNEVNNELGKENELLKDMRKLLAS